MHAKNSCTFDKMNYHNIERGLGIFPVILANSALKPEF